MYRTGSITTLEATRLDPPVCRLSERIRELEAKGWAFDHTVPDKAKHYTRYVLLDTPVTQDTEPMSESRGLADKVCATCRNPDYIKASKLIKQLLGNIGKDEPTWATKLMALSQYHCDMRSCEDCVFRQHLTGSCFSCVLVEECGLSQPEDWHWEHHDIINLLKILSPNELIEETKTIVKR
jgi:hypothetical protein